MEGELEELCEALDIATGEHENQRARLEAGRATREEAGAGLEHADARGRVARAHGQQSVVTERKVRLARVRERATSMRGTVERISRSCDELGGRIKRLDDEREESARNAGKAAALMMTAREKLVDDVALAQAAHAELSEARKALDEARQALAVREADLRGLRTEVSESSERLQKHEMALQRLTIELTHVVEGVRERFRGLEIAHVIGDYHKRKLVDAAHRARITELGELINRMGPVNVDAMREHAEAETRFTYYDSQKKILEKALDDLKKAIAQMNKESKRLFRTTFEGINARFKMLFPRCSAAAPPSCGSPTPTTCWRRASRSSRSRPARSSATSS